MSSSGELGVLPALKAILDAPSSTAAQKQEATATLWSLSAVSPEHQVLLCSTEAGVVPSLVAVLQKEPSESVVRSNTLSCISNLVVAPENKAKLAAPSVGLLAALATVVATETAGDNLLTACGVLLRLSVAPEARALVAAEPGLLAALVAVLRSSHDAAKVRLPPPEPPLPIRLLPWHLPHCHPLPACCCLLVRSSQAKVLGCLWNLSVHADNLPLLAAPALGLLPALAQALRADGGGLPGEGRVSACGVLLYLSRESDCRAPLCAPDLGLIDALVALVAAVDAGAARGHACGILNNLCLSPALQVRPIYRSI